MARELPIRNGRLTTDLDADGHKIKNLPPGEGFTQAQADWNQSDSTKPDFIKNKPTIPAPVTVDSALSETSENPVQNKVVTESLAEKLSRAEAGFTEWTSIDASIISASWLAGVWTFVFIYDGAEETATVEGPIDATMLTTTSYVDVERTRLPTMADIPDGSTSMPHEDSNSTKGPGTSSRYAREDHVHPSDSSKQDVISDLAAIRSGAQAGATAYQKPSGGIPKTDLAGAVQTSLGKADTAVQPEGIAGLMPMYPFSAPTFAQTANSFSFSGTDAASGYHYEIEYSSGTWSLYKVADGSTHSSGDVPMYTNNTAAESATVVEFNSGAITATRGYVATLSPFTNAQIEMGEWTFIKGVENVVSGPTYSNGAWTVDVVFHGQSDRFTADETAEDATSLTFSGGLVTATRPPSAFEIAVGALPAGVTGKARDCILVIDCTAEGAVAPTVTWPDNWAPRTSAEDDLTVEVGVNVYYVTEYEPGKFVVARWLEPTGGES